MARSTEGETTTERVREVIGAEEDLLAEFVRVGLQALMEAERDEYVGAGRFERMCVL